MIAPTVWTGSHRAWLLRWGTWAAIAISLLAGLGMRSPSPPDEPRFVLAAKAMEASGNWLLPHRGIELYAEKPPVFMWMQLAAHRIFPDWNVAFLLPSLLAALLTLWLTHRLGCLFWGRRVGRYAALALFCTVQFGLMAKRAQIDMVLVGLTTLSLWGLARHLVSGPAPWAMCVGAFAAGVGTVTKGVGFLPLLLLVPWLALRWTARAPPVRGKAWHWLLLPAGFIAGTGVWLVPLGLELAQAHSSELDAYARDILFRQTGTRYVASWHHVKPFWYYAQVMLTLWLPGSLLLPMLVPAWARRLRRLDRRHVMLIGWVVLVLLFFSATPGKREVYIFPALPAACLAAAPLLAGLLRRPAARWILWLYLAAMAAAALALGGVLLLEPALLSSRLEGRDLEGAAVGQLGLWLVTLGLLLCATFALGSRRIATALVAGTCALWIVHGVGIMPVLDPYASSSRLMANVERRIGSDATLGLVDWREQNYLQAARPPVDFGFKAPIEQQWERAYAWTAADPGRRWILVDSYALPRCMAGSRHERVGQANRNSWVLIHGPDIPDRCRFEHPATRTAPDND